MMKVDGFDDCIIGVVSRCGSEDILAYDSASIVSKLMFEQGMDSTEAWEYFEFNIEGAYMGEGTPCFMSPYDPEVYHD